MGMRQAADQVARQDLAALGGLAVKGAHLSFGDVPTGEIPLEDGFANNISA